MAITITSPVERQVIQRQGNNTALLTIEGSVTGAVSQVQAMATSNGWWKWHSYPLGYNRFRYQRRTVFWRAHLRCRRLVQHFGTFHEWCYCGGYCYY